MLRVKMITEEVPYVKMPHTCESKLAKWHIPCLGAVIFSAELAIALVVVILELNQQVENLQFILQNNNPYQTPSPAACNCPQTLASLHGEGFDNGVGNEKSRRDSSSMMKFTSNKVDKEAVSTRKRRQSVSRSRVNCCDIEAKTARKLIKGAIKQLQVTRSARSKREKPGSQVPVNTNRRDQRSVLVTANAEIAELNDGEDDGGSDVTSNKVTKPQICGAHLIGQFNREFSKGIGEFETLHEWTYNSQGAYLRKMAYNQNDGHVEIKVSGFYYVYCQLHYIQASTWGTSEWIEVSSSDSNGPNKIMHKVIRKNRIKQHNVLLSSEIIPGEENYAVYSDFESKIVYLEEGDIVYVRAHVPRTNGWQYILSSEHDRTFFGLLLLEELWR